MKKFLFGVGVLVGGMLILGISLDPERGGADEGSAPTLSEAIFGKHIPEEKQADAAAAVDTVVAYVVSYRQALIDQVQVADRGSANWEQVIKILTQLEEGQKVVGYLNPEYAKQEKMIQELSEMAIHFKKYMENRKEYSVEFARGMDSLKKFEQIYNN